MLPDHELQDRLAQTTRELAELRAAMAATVDGVDDHLRVDDRRAAEHWFARWREANRKRGAELVELERLKAANAQLARERDELRAALEAGEREATETLERLRTGIVERERWITTIETSIVEEDLVVTISNAPMADSHER